MTKSKGRLFVAVSLTDLAQRRLSEHLDSNVPDGRLPGRVVPAGNWHFTLRFLGDTSDAAYDAVRAHLRQAELGPPFELRFAGLGAFPKPDRARVLWIGTSQGAAEMESLAAAAEDAAVASGFEPERRRFRAHLTVARLRPDRDVRSLVDAVPVADASMTVAETVIYRSHLSPEGARYEVLDRLPLGDA